MGSAERLGGGGGESRGPPPSGTVSWECVTVCEENCWSWEVGAHGDSDHREGHGGVFGGQIFGSGKSAGPMGKTGGEERCSPTWTEGRKETWAEVQMVAPGDLGLRSA